MNFNYYKKLANIIFNTPSPSGYTKEIVKVVSKELKNMGYNFKVTNKGNIEVVIDGADNSKVVATSAHMDTLGLMVRSINEDGTLNVVAIGGILVPTLDGEYVTILTRDGKKYSGTCLSTSPSIHVYKDASTKARDIEHVIVRIDENVNSKNDVLKLGIQNGDYIFVDPKTTFTKSGFLKSRFIDDKASVCAILNILKIMSKNNLKPKYKTIVYFVNQEELGYGASAISSEIDEFVTVDMGCVGLDLDGSEYKVSIAAKDSMGPYNYDLTTKLVSLAKDNNIEYALDIFPMYGSDVDAAFRSGRDFKGALIGQGVHASHGMERTHLCGIENTMKLLFLYLVDIKAVMDKYSECNFNIFNNINNINDIFSIFEEDLI